MDRIERERDVEQLRKMALLLAKENQRLIERVVELQGKLLKAQGKDAQQLMLEIAALQKELEERANNIGRNTSEKRGEKSGSDKKPQTGHGPREQPKLPVVDQLWTLDVPDQACPACGGKLEEWSGQFDDSEEVDLIERQFVIRRHRRQKYRCQCGGCVETAPGPRRMLAGGRYSAVFAIAVAVGKYLDHLPLERQVRQMARQGLVCDSQTLFDQCWALCSLVRPAYDRLRALQREQPVLFADETSWPLFGEKGKTARASKWKIWTVTSEIGIYNEIRDGRSAAIAESLLGGYSGYVMCDGYVVYESIAKTYPELRLVHCWAHARRKFIECEAAFPLETKRVLDLIGKLYEIEGRSRGAPKDERLRIRQEESRAVVEEIKAALLEPRPVPGSGLYEAIQYVSKRWTRLTRFLDDPVVPLDNNAAERALRSPVLGRKNHYGSRSLRGTEVAAILYSLIESAKLVELDPTLYLQRAVDAALDGLPVPLPHELAAAR
ncbi:MAG: IS66 family transposase [Bryobacterales bacterium]